MQEPTKHPHRGMQDKYAEIVKTTKRQSSNPSSEMKREQQQKQKQKQKSRSRSMYR